MSAIDELPVRIMFEGNWYVIEIDAPKGGGFILSYRPIFYFILRTSEFVTKNKYLDTAASSLLTKLKEAKII